MATSKEKSAEVAERRRRCAAMRRQGHRWETIAKALGYKTAGAACQDHRRALDATMADLKQEVSAWRAQELDRIDELQEAIWESAKAGDEKLLNVVVKLLDRRARMLGLDAPREATVALHGSPDGPPIAITDVPASEAERQERERILIANLARKLGAGPDELLSVTSLDQLAEPGEDS